MENENRLAPEEDVKTEDETQVGSDEKPAKAKRKKTTVKKTGKSRATKGTKSSAAEEVVAEEAAAKTAVEAEGASAPEKETIAASPSERYAELFLGNNSKEEKAAPAEIAESGQGKSKWKKGGKIFALIVGIIILCGLLGSAGYFYYKYKQVPKKDANLKESAALVERISQVAILPNEEPTVAAVTDAEKLKEQPFFAGAQNGDKVLFFAQAKKAVLFRPGENKIVEMMALNGALPGSQTENVTPANEQSAAKEPDVVTEENTEAPREKMKVAVYNGTKIKGLAKTTAEKIGVVEKIEIVSTGNAAGNYEKTLIIDFSGQNEELINNIKEKIGGETGQLPEGESKPTADILIIAGSDAENK